MKNRLQPRRSRLKRAAVLMAALSVFTGGSAAAEERTSAFARALAAYRDRQMEEAFLHAKEAVRESPDHPDAYLLLGELYYYRQELEPARESWEKALELAPSRQDIRERLEKLEREEKVEKDLARRDTYPFVVRFAREGAVAPGSLQQLLRDAHRLVGREFQYFPDYPITVILYPEADFEQVKGLSHAVSGVYDGKIRLPIAESLPESARKIQLKRVLWHEYAHVLLHDLSKGDCPLWLNEGVATLVEAGVAQPTRETVREALGSKRILSWEHLWSETSYRPEELDFYYTHGYLIARYLTERWGWPRLVSLLERLGRGYPIQDALRAEYKEEPATLEKEWLSWVKREFL